MARLKTSGTLALNEVIAFFGGGNSLRDFLRGGGLVPNISQNNGVPSSGTITLRDLLGAYDASPLDANLTNHTIEGFFSGFGSSNAVFELGNDGQASGSGTGAAVGTGNYSGEWLVAGSANQFEAMATASGTINTGDALDTWLNLGTTRSWGVLRGTAGVSSGSITVQIRPAGGGTVLDSATITMYAYR